jgi:HK97 family phage major capsid protein
VTVEEILAAIQAILDAAKGEDGEERPLTEDEVAEVEDLERKLDLARKTEEIVKRNAAYRSSKAPAVITGKTSRGDDEVARAFDQYLRTGRVSDMIQRAQGEASGPAGGFLVPDGFRAQMVERRKAFGGVANNCEVITTESGNPLPWPLNDDTANVGAIVAEGANVPQGGADLVFATRALGAYKYGSGGASNAALKVSWELAQDSAFNLGEFVARKLGERIARAQAADWVVGTGTGEPQGLLSAQGGITAATALSSNSAPTYADLVTIVHDLDPEYREGAVWVFNDGFLEVLRKMEDQQDRPLFGSLNSWAMGDNPGGSTLLGFPVIIDQACPDPSSGNLFGFFGNLREAYVIRRVKDLTMVTLNEMYAANGQVGYLAWERADGMVQNPYAGVLLKAQG